MALLRRPQFYPSASGLRQPDSDGLFCGTSAMLAELNVLDLLMNKFPSLCCRSFALACVVSSSLENLVFRHTDLLDLSCNCDSVMRLRQECVTKACQFQ